MNYTRKLSIPYLLTITCLYFSSALAQTASNPDTSVVIKQVLTTSKAWDGSALSGFNTGVPELKVLTYKVAPNAKLPPHIHPMNGAGYMLSGELTIYSTTDPSGSFSDSQKVKKIQLKAGDAWSEVVNIWHYGENNGKEDANFVLVFAGEKGTPVTLNNTGK